MGTSFGVQSDSLQSTVSDVNNIINCVSTSINQMYTSNCSALNTVTFNYCPTFSCPMCDFTNKQVASSTCKLDVNALNKVSASFSQNLYTQLSRYVNTQVQNTSSFLGTAVQFGFVSDTFNTELKTYITNTFSTNLTQTCGSTINSFNQAIWNFCGVYQDANFTNNQLAATTGLTICVNTNIFNFSVNQTTSYQSFIQANQYLLNKQSSDIVWIIFLIVFIVIIFILGFFGVFISLFSKSKKTTVNVTPSTSSSPTTPM